MVNLTKSEREFCVYLVETAREVNPENPEQATFIAAPLGTFGSQGEVLVKFKSRSVPQSSSNRVVVAGLQDVGYIIPMRENVYRISPQLFDLVDSNFSLAQREGWVDIPVNIPYLVSVITERFNHDEFASLCMDLDVNQDEMGKDSAPISDRATRLTHLLLEGDRLGALLRAVNLVRPGAINWPNLFED